MHDVERASGVGGGDDRLAGQERLVRAEPEVLVERRVVRREARCVETGQLGSVGAAREADTPADAAVACEAPQPVAVGAIADDDDLERGLERSRLDQQVDALGTVESVDREDEVPMTRVVVVEVLRRGPQHLGHEPRRALQAARHVPGDGETAGSPHRGRPDRDPAPSVAAPAPRGSRRTARGRCGRARTPAGTDARATRASRGAARRRRGTSWR